MGQPLYCWALVAGVWGEQGYGDGYTPYVWLSCISLLPWLPSFPPQAFSTTISSLTSAQSVPPQSTATSPWDCSTIPKLQLPAAVLPRGPVSLSQVCMAATRTVWFSFHLGCHRSAVSLSALNVSPVTQDNCSNVGIGPLLQFPLPLSAGPVLLTLLFFLIVPLSYQVLHGSIYSFLMVRYSCPLSAGVLHDYNLCWVMVRYRFPYLVDLFQRWIWQYISNTIKNIPSQFIPNKQSEIHV